MTASGTSTPRAAALRLEDRAAGGRVGGLELDDHPAEEPGGQLVGQPGDQPGVLVGRQDDRHALVDQGVEGVEELVLRGPLGGQEVDVVDDQAAGAPEPVAEAAERAGAHRLEEAVGERLGGELDHVEARVRAPQGVADPFEQVRLAQPDAAVDDQRVEGGAGRLGHLARRGLRQAVAGPGDEVLQPAARPPRDERPPWSSAGDAWDACIRSRGWG